MTDTLSNAQKVSDERLELWRHRMERIVAGYGDPYPINSEILALLTELQALRAAPTPDAHSEVGVKEPKGLKTTPAMRERIRELSRTDGRDDYDRAVLALLDDFEAQLTATSDKLVRYTHEYYSGVYSGMTPYARGEWVRYDDPALTAGVVKAEPVAAGVVVTDEMVEQAYGAWLADTYAEDWEVDEIKSQIRAALTAEPQAVEPVAAPKTRKYVIMRKPVAEEKPAEPVEAYGVYLNDGRFMCIAESKEEDAITQAENFYETGDYHIRPLYAQFQPSKPDVFSMARAIHRADYPTELSASQEWEGQKHIRLDQAKAALSVLAQPQPAALTAEPQAVGY